MEVNTVRISPSKLGGKINAPAGKSMMQRALALALLNPGRTTITNAGFCNDDLHVLEIIKLLGASVIHQNDSLIITGTDKLNSVPKIHCGESGLALRMFTPIVAITEYEIELTGEKSLCNRTHHFPYQAFQQLNIQVLSNQNKIPIKIKGPILPQNIQLSASESSQYLTGLLIALAHAASESIIVQIESLVSKPYVELTISLLQHFGYNITNFAENKITINPTDKKNRDIALNIEGDWSGASFLLLAAALSGDIEITGLQQHSIQADRAFLRALSDSGTIFQWNENSIVIRENKNILPFEFDATDCPDLFPALSVLAAYANGTSKIIGVNRLANKESNRASAIFENLTALGVSVDMNDNMMLIHGKGFIQGGVVKGFADHRMVMAMSVAALRSSAPITINDANAVSKSYPNFYTDLKSLGTILNLIL
jgi:3-phosphoshikimate 1-carboxyvinyltransferase